MIESEAETDESRIAGLAAAPHSGRLAICPPPALVPAACPPPARSPTLVATASWWPSHPCSLPCAGGLHHPVLAPVDAPGPIMGASRDRERARGRTSLPVAASEVAWPPPARHGRGHARQRFDLSQPLLSLTVSSPAAVVASTSRCGHAPTAGRTCYGGEGVASFYGSRRFSLDGEKCKSPKENGELCGMPGKFLSSLQKTNYDID